jgi:hypothetical protein
MTMLAALVLLMSACYLLWLGMLALLRPAQSTAFLQSFAQVAWAHYLELSVRFAIGAACLQLAPQLSAPQIYQLAGWGLLLTTAGLLLMPWRWHQRIALRATANIGRWQPLIGLSSLGLAGVLIRELSLLFPALTAW